jgi:hypothetical protein
MTSALLSKQAVVDQDRVVCERAGPARSRESGVGVVGQHLADLQLIGQALELLVLVGGRRRLLIGEPVVRFPDVIA